MQMLNARKLYRFLYSRNFALIMLVALLALSLAGVIIPQDSVANHQEYLDWSGTHHTLNIFLSRLGLTRMFVSPLFLGINALLFISLTLCFVRQLRSLLRFLRNQPTQNIPSGAPMQLVNLECAITLEDMTAAVQKKGYRSGSIDENTGVLRTWKNNTGHWGSVLLHFGIMIIMLGGLISGLTKMEGSFLLGEGQTKHESKEAYLETVLSPLFPGHKGFSISLDKVSLVYPDSELPYTDTLKMTFAKGSKKTTETILDGKSGSYGMFNYWPSKHGYAVGLVLYNANSQPINGSFFHLSTLIQDKKVSYQEKITELAPDLTINSSFFPNYELTQDGKLQMKSLEPVHPALWLTVTQGDVQIFDGYIEPGGKAKIGAYTLEFAEYRKNVGFTVSYDPGVPFIFSGFLFCVLGLSLLYLFQPRQLWVKISPSHDSVTLEFWGRSKRLPALFKSELTELIKYFDLELNPKKGV